jgi:hypothetical protein
MAWTALAWVGLFNAALRDAKFALPLLLLAALGSAHLLSARTPSVDADGGPNRQQAG